MIPVALAGCRGWLHPAAGARGVVLCPPFGHEGLAVHRSLRDLAGRLAASGLPVLRLDPPGCGDSADPPEGSLLPSWQASLRAAAAALRAGGCGAVTLVGVRLGASMALLSGADADSLACLAPVVSGRTHLREVRMLSGAPGADGAIAVVGERLAAADVAALSALDLGQAGDAPRHVLLMEREGRERARLLARLDAAGASLCLHDLPGRDAWLQDAILSVPPAESLDALRLWLLSLPVAPGAFAVQAMPGAGPDADLPVPGGAERAVRFGTGLAGVMTLPDRPTGAPPVLLLNTGMTRQTGNGRLGVRLARRLAALGVATLRMDAAGIGDAADLPPGRGLPVYDRAAVPEVRAALDWLEAEGHAEATLVGLCSGAFLALHAARSDPRVRGLVLMNLQCFTWIPGGSLQVQGHQGRRPAGFYLRAALRREGWRRLLRGEVRFARLCLRLGGRVGGGLGRAALRRMERLGGPATRAGEVRRWLLDLSRRGTWLRLWYSEADPGLSELAQHAGAGGRELRGLPGTEVAVLPTHGHALTELADQERFLERLLPLLATNGTEERAFFFEKKNQKTFALMASNVGHVR